MTLSVPHYQQQTPYTCLPACVRMVLAFLGHAHTENELAEAFRTVPLIGTLPENVIGALQKMGYHALWFENATAERLFRLSEHDWPVIALLLAQDLPNGIAGMHAVVVSGLNDQQITFLDPMQTEATVMSTLDFLQAWDNLDNQGIVVWVQVASET